MIMIMKYVIWSFWIFGSSTKYLHESILEAKPEELGQNNHLKNLILNLLLVLQLTESNLKKLLMNFGMKRYVDYQSNYFQQAVEGFDIVTNFLHKVEEIHKFEEIHNFQKIHSFVVYSKKDHSFVVSNPEGCQGFHSSCQNYYYYSHFHFGLFGLCKNVHYDFVVIAQQQGFLFWQQNKKRYVGYCLCQSNFCQINLTALCCCFDQKNNQVVEGNSQNQVWS